MSPDDTLRPPTIVAYFSMEIGFDAAAPTYSGGLGVLAGDTLRAAADLGVPMVAVSLLYRKGHLRQRLGADGEQLEEPEAWRPESLLERLETRVAVDIEGRRVKVAAWRYHMVGVGGGRVPILFLDTDLSENDALDRALTDVLYGGDERYRLCQEVVLGLGGLRMLRALGFQGLTAFHMNEGHSALLTLGLLGEQLGGSLSIERTAADVEAVRRKCVFTTHTPVPAGHDRFPASLVSAVLGKEVRQALESLGCLDDELNMTSLALSFARHINGVSTRHETISRGMFPHYPIRSITNGVHAVTWTSQPFRALFDRHVVNWRFDNFSLRYARGIPLDEIQRAHAESKQLLLDEVKSRTGQEFDPSTLTIGFARRATPYKRADLIFRDLDRLRCIAEKVGPIQLVFAGRAHPDDGDGKAMIRRVFAAKKALSDTVPVVYLQQYDTDLGRLMTAGVDVWLNTPQKPQEASGTSGMKAALNGVPSLSILDGWWVEGHIEGVTGWSIDDGEEVSNEDNEVRSLYNKLEFVVVPMYYRRPEEWAGIMRSAIELNGSFFNAQRMITEYNDNAYEARKRVAVEE